jgi:myo-inositol-1(or 4)-monophosphatase
MPSPGEPQAADWLACFREATRGIEAELRARPHREQRERVVGRGSGGDNTTEIDQVAEDVVVRALSGLAAQGAAFTLVSEELGERTFGDGSSACRVVVDPIDGSLNAKRGIPLFALSIAVADGPTMGDVFLGFVHDLGGGEEWVAERGRGAWLGSERLGAQRPRDRFEIVAFEATSPALVAAAAARLPSGEVERVRLLGSLALALCNVAAGRVDALASLKPTRAVDIAAGQLVVREAGFAVTLPDGPGGLPAAPLDASDHAHVVAALDDERCERLSRLLGHAPTMPA